MDKWPVKYSFARSLNLPRRLWVCTNSAADALYQHPVFIGHAKAVVQMLDLAINMLGPDMDPVTVTLTVKDLGARHTVYGVLAPHYEIVG
ncbi:globin-like protein [Nitzschia inconspicua]|uniref:Globin-like protein n=1 Tax=Nitzschia inconspicua TaxID=303405 RepID=A0A9K3KCH4_9STRA|nr:globin-like protein [Nitzschia inconspicua]